jgi:hypothetical protein
MNEAPSHPPTPRRVRPREFQEVFDRVWDLKYAAVNDIDYDLACFWRDTGRFYQNWHFDCMLGGML